ncbi:MAG: transglycosylase domain-containing protein [Myxococcota bacterium]
MTVPWWLPQLGRAFVETGRAIVRAWPFAIGLGLLGMMASSVLQVMVVGVVTPPWTLTMIEQARELDRWPRRRVRSMRRLGDLGPRAFVASEDAKFFLHHGFDWGAICSVATSGQSRGASTISQQVAKNVFLWQARSYTRKLMEAWYTLWLETFLSKHRILELYMNVAETGPAVFGLEAGARHHFGKTAKRLSQTEVGRIAGILPNPKRSIEGKSAWSRARFIARHPAPFPGDKGFGLQQRHFDDQPHGPWSCFE